MPTMKAESIQICQHCTAYFYLNDLLGESGALFQQRSLPDFGKSSVQPSL